MKKKRLKNKKKPVLTISSIEKMLFNRIESDRIPSFQTGPLGYELLNEALKQYQLKYVRSRFKTG